MKFLPALLDECLEVFPGVLVYAMLALTFLGSPARAQGPAAWTETELKAYIDAEIDAKVDAAVAKALATRLGAADAQTHCSNGNCPMGGCDVQGACGVARCVCSPPDPPATPNIGTWHWQFIDGQWQWTRETALASAPTVTYTQPAYVGGWQTGPTYYQMDDGSLVAADDGSGTSGSCGAADGKGPIRRLLGRLFGR